MSAQCWCFTCAGKVVCRKTYVKHGRKDKPDSPVRKRARVRSRTPSPPRDVAAAAFAFDEVEFVEPELLDPLALLDTSSDSDVDDELDELEEGLQPLLEGTVTPKEASVLLLDWASAHKVSDKAISGAWRIARLLVSSSGTRSRMRSWDSIKKVLRQFEEHTMKTIDICPNDCVAFWNSEHLQPTYHHAHRTKCPECGAARYVTDPVDGRVKPVKVVYHFLLGPFIQGLFARPDMVKHLHLDVGDHPESHITRSRGFKVHIHIHSNMC